MMAELEQANFGVSLASPRVGVTDKIERALFWLLIGFCVAPVWSMQYLPTQDGPSHVYNAVMLRDFARGGGAVFRRFFEINPRLSPNLLGHYLMAALMFLVSPWTAEKILVSLCVVLLPLSARYAAGRVDRRGTIFAFLIFPLIYSRLLNKGLYNNCLALPLYFYFVGYWISRSGRFNARSALGLLGLSLLLYFSHAVALLEAYMTVGLWSVGVLVMDARAGRRPGMWRRMVLPLAALAPSLLLTKVFFDGEASQAMGHTFRNLVISLVRFDCLISYRKSETIWSMSVLGLFLMLGMAGLWRMFCRKAVRDDLLLLGVVATVVCYFITPNNAAGGGLISARLLLFIALAAVPWLACTPLPAVARLIVGGASAALCVVFVGTYTFRNQQFNAYLDEYALCAAHIPPGSTLLPICISDHGIGADGKALSILPGVRVFLHASSRIAVERGLIDLSNYEAMEDYFPIRFRVNLSPRGCIDGFGRGLLGYGASTGGQANVDYVLVWSIREGDGQHRETAEDKQGYKEAMRQVQQGYQLVYTSPHGFLRLYRRNDIR